MDETTVRHVVPAGEGKDTRRACFPVSAAAAGVSKSVRARAAHLLRNLFSIVSLLR
jgi:hypothetical protein